MYNRIRASLKLRISKEEEVLGEDEFPSSYIKFEVPVGCLGSRDCIDEFWYSGEMGLGVETMGLKS